MTVTAAFQTLPINDLKVTLIGTTDSVTVSNWFANDGNHVSTFQTADGHVLADSEVQNLVSAMAGLTPPPIGQTTLTTPPAPAAGFGDRRELALSR